MDPGTSGTLNALHETQVLASNIIINNKHYNYTNTNILCLPFKYQILKRLPPLSRSDMYMCIDYHNKFHRKGGRCGCTCSGKLCVT